MKMPLGHQVISQQRLSKALHRASAAGTPIKSGKPTLTGSRAPAFTRALATRESQTRTAHGNSCPGQITETTTAENGHASRLQGQFLQSTLSLLLNVCWVTGGLLQGREMGLRDAMPPSVQGSQFTSLHLHPAPFPRVPGTQGRLRAVPIQGLTSPSPAERHTVATSHGSPSALWAFRSAQGLKGSLAEREASAVPCTSRDPQGVAEPRLGGGVAGTFHSPSLTGGKVAQASISLLLRSTWARGLSPTPQKGPLIRLLPLHPAQPLLAVWPCSSQGRPCEGCFPTWGGGS